MAILTKITPSSNLSNNALTGPLPKLFTSTPLLKTLYLDSNSLSGPLPPSLLNSSALVHLHLSNNTFTLPSPARSSPPSPLSFPSAINLQTVYLASNHLEGPLVLSAFLNPALQKLVLDYNRLSGPLPSFADMPAATIVSMKGNRFEGEVQEFGSAKGLVKVDLSGNMLTGAYPDPSGLEHLSYLCVFASTLLHSLLSPHSVPSTLY